MEAKTAHYPVILGNPRESAGMCRNSWECTGIRGNSRESGNLLTLFFALQDYSGLSGRRKFRVSLARARPRHGDDGHGDSPSGDGFGNREGTSVTRKGCRAFLLLAELSPRLGTPLHGNMSSAESTLGESESTRKHRPVTPTDLLSSSLVDDSDNDDGRIRCMKTSCLLKGEAVEAGEAAREGSCFLLDTSASPRRRRLHHANEFLGVVKSLKHRMDALGKEDVGCRYAPVFRGRGKEGVKMQA
ncbi:hypothetical protein ARMGADRAFT_1031520 [Armillaria gallica]|uniref:Uncharacterized protein n=1 Tax=Armillaria gallica TaxID=47427 RepID=A0A2H3D7V2_ARMGA|nr:hypothetical protein ARMGADRAFT_1031520 [Armillaria gallica]